MVLCYNTFLLITVSLNRFVDVIRKLFAKETLISYSSFESFDPFISALFMLPTYLRLNDNRKRTCKRYQLKIIKTS